MTFTVYEIEKEELLAKLRKKTEKLDDAMNYIGWIADQVHKKYHPTIQDWWDCKEIVCLSALGTLNENGKNPTETGFKLPSSE